MNAWFLVIALLVALVFGYRFYAKLLALDIFRLDANYSTPAHSRADGRDYVPTHPHLLFGHQIAAVGGAVMFAAPVAAAAWGWIPAFLWITLGSAVAAGTYGLGSFWLSLRFAKGLRHIATDLIGRHARLALFLLALAALVVLMAASAGLTAVVLAAYPGAALPLIALVLVALVLGTFLHGRTESELLPATIVAFAASLLLVWLLSAIPLAVNGALVVAVGDTPLLSVNAVLVWVVLLLAYAFHAARLPIWKLTRPHGFLAALLLAVMLAIFYLALAIEHPTLAAPEFHSPRASASQTLPWLFLIVGPGALAGWQLLLIHHVTAREMRRETDARYIGYGTALVHGFVALSALLIGATGFSDAEQWASHYAAAPSAADFPRFLASYIDGFGLYAVALGFDPLFARNLAATVIAALTLAVLEASLRALKHLLAELSPAPGRRGEGERGRLWMSVLAGGLLALSDGRGLGGLAAWPFLALASLWLAAAGFGLIAFALRVLNRSAQLIALLAGAVAALAAWGTVAQLRAWWASGDWLAFGAGVILLLLAGLIGRDSLRALRRGAAKPASA